MQFRQWWNTHIGFVSWGKYWKGVYIHCFPWCRIRIFLWGIDFKRKVDYVVDRFELVECSIVSIPPNPACVFKKEPERKVET